MIKADDEKALQQSLIKEAKDKAAETINSVKDKFSTNIDEFKDKTGLNFNDEIIYEEAFWTALILKQKMVKELMDKVRLRNTFQNLINQRQN